MWTGVLFLYGSIILARLQAFLGVTCSYSNHPFLCTLGYVKNIWHFVCRWWENPLHCWETEGHSSISPSHNCCKWSLFIHDCHWETLFITKWSQWMCNIFQLYSGPTTCKLFFFVIGPLHFLANAGNFYTLNFRCLHKIRRILNTMTWWRKWGGFSLTSWY